MSLSRFAGPLLALSCAAPLGCHARVYPEPYAATTVTATPYGIEAYPYVYYGGRPTYWYGDRWWYRHGPSWYYYYPEPPALYRQRPYLYSAPPAYGAPYPYARPPYVPPPASAPPAWRRR